MSKPNFNNVDIKETLTTFRNNLRSGDTRMLYHFEGAKSLRWRLAQAFGIDNDAFNSQNFNQQTLVRFATLFDVPTLFTVDGAKWPTADETATAVQNFINRRAKPWAHFSGTTPNTPHDHATLPV